MDRKFIIVTSCEECPYYRAVDFYSAICAETENEIPCLSVNRLNIPEWCPLDSFVDESGD